MAGKQPKITRREFDIARSFISRLKGNVQNTYLILAVIAWLRAMNKAHDKYWKSLSRLSGREAGARLAQHLRNKASAGKYAAEYKRVLTVVARKSATANGMADVAASFILGITKSHYDSKHYGYVEAKDAETVWVPPHVTINGFYVPGAWEYHPAVAGKNPLFDAYAALTNKPNIPDKWWITVTKTTKTKVIPPRPHQPRSLMHVLPQPDYIQPYAAANFYDAKPHYGDNILLDG